MPLRTKITLHGFRFNKDGWTRAVEKTTQSSVLEAARAWVQAVIERVPIWSGQALGSIKYAKGRSGPSSGLFLGQYLKVQIPIDAPFQKPDKNPFTGGLQARYNFSSFRHQYKFSFQTNVIYYIIQDFFNIGVSPTAPWGSFDAGSSAFERTLSDEMLRRLPTIDTFILDAAVTNG